jgi:hypothetical protein
VTLERTNGDDLRRLLSEGAEDGAVCDAFDRLLVSQNAEFAAAGYLAVAGFVCARRPGLAERILRAPVECCFQLGAERAEAVARFAESVARDADYGPRAGPDGARWLCEELPRLTALIAELLHKCREDFHREFPDA